MPVLLDTHTLLWWLTDDRRLSDLARSTIADRETQPLVSAATIWAIAIKRALGKLDAPDDLPDLVIDQGFALVEIEAAEAWTVGALPRHHGDPFDRLLVAQALTRGVPLLSADRTFDAYGVDRRW